MEAMGSGSAEGSAGPGETEGWERVVVGQHGDLPWKPDAMG